VRGANSAFSLLFQNDSQLTVHGLILLRIAAKILSSVRRAWNYSSYSDVISIAACLLRCCAIVLDNF